VSKLKKGSGIRDQGPANASPSHSSHDSHCSHAEHPILFTAAMVQAILEGRKTQTRRVIAGQLDNPTFWQHGGYRLAFDIAAGKWGFYYREDTERALGSPLLRCPYGVPGDRLWVRETWRRTTSTNGLDSIAYRSDDSCFAVLCSDSGEGDPVKVDLRKPMEPFISGTWRPSIFMPRWASRITLEITEVRAQRVQEISESDAIAEGIETCFTEEEMLTLPAGSNDWRNYLWHGESGITKKAMALSTSQYSSFASPVSSYRSLWDSINGHLPGRSWADNPWVWAITFKLVSP
jgi:hypothetical protein